MFKVGDRVKRVKCFKQNAKEGWPDFIEGAVYTVTSEYKGMLKLENMGQPNTPFHPYDACCFELVKPEPQAAAIAGGLQKHSVGEYYPLAVVTYDTGTETALFVENLQEGTVAVLSTNSSYPYQFDSHDDAIRAIENGSLMFSEGRPHYVPEAAVWVLYKQANPVRVTRLRNMLHRG